MATYVNDLRLKEIATGDEAGTWGTSTNTNLELIAEAFSFGTEAITTNADTHTTTIADGSTDPGRSIYLKYTGTLDSACTITIGPNTVSKLWFIENGTSGSQNIIISQGSGANVTIPAGHVKAIYSDGAGSGAAMADAFTDLNLAGTTTIDVLSASGNATIGGTLGVTGIVTLTDDLIIGDGKTIGSASDVDAMTIASNGQVTFSQTLIGTALDISGDIDVDGTTNLDVVDIDGALTQDGGAVFNEDSADVDFRVESNGNANMLFVDGGNNRVGVGAAPSSPFSVSAADGTLANFTNASDADFQFKTASAVALLTPSTGTLAFGTSDTERMRINSSGLVSIGTTTTDRELKVQKSGDHSIIAVVSGTSSLAGMVMGDTDDDDIGHILYNNSNNSMSFRTNTSDKMTIASTGAIGMGTTPPTDTHTGWTQLFIGQKGSVISENATGVHGLDGTFVTDNMYVDSDTGAFAYIEANESSAYRQEAGIHQFFTQASGSAGAAVTLSEKIRIDSAGSIGVGTTSPGTVSGGIHAVHANSEGTPTFDGGEVLILQRNFNSSQSCSMSMVAGTNAACTINMGDKDDVNRSFITSHQGTDTMGFTVATGSALEIVSGRGGGTGRTVSATGNGGLCFGSAETNTGGCLMAAADNAQSEGIVFYLTASASEWQPASIVAHCSKIDSDQSDHNYGNVAYGFSILGNGSLATVQKYEENPSGGAGITWSLNDLGGTTTMQIQILATSDNSTGPRIVLSAWAANYSGVLEANRS